MCARLHQVLDHIPAMEESAYDASLEPEPAGAAAAAAAATVNGSTGDAAADLAALLGLDMGADLGMAAMQPAGAAPAPTQAAGISALSDLLGGDLLGGMPPSAAPAAPAAFAAPPAAPMASADPLADLFGGGPVAAATPSAADALFGMALTAFQKGPITITFALTKEADPSTTSIVATFANAGGEEVGSFTLQAAVPKFMQVRERAHVQGGCPALVCGPARPQCVPAAGCGCREYRPRPPPPPHSAPLSPCSSSWTRPAAAACPPTAPA